MRRFSSVFAVVVVIVLALLYMSTYTVSETQRAIKFRLGEIIATDIKPGLHFKLPLINNVRKFDARVQTLDEEPQRFLTVEKKNVIVDAFVKWRIGDVENFYTTVGGDPTRANLRLAEIIKNGLRNEFGKRTIREVVSGDRSQIMDILRGQASDAASSLGMDIV
ncbi:MAG: protease modulator HflC, partial [Ectothiorhodospiraceae bacterium]